MKDNSDWYCYEQQKAIALPPVGAECEMFWGGISKGTVEFIAKRGERIIFWRHEHDCVDSAELPTTELKPLDHETRAKELEKKRVVDASLNQLGQYGRDTTQFLSDCIAELYDLGFIKLP